MGLGIKSALLRPLEPWWLYRLPARRFRRHGDASQHGESLLLQSRVTDDFPRFIVDVGANDGVRNSNSYYFLHRGWRGILIEPHPNVFSRLTARYAGRPDVRCVNVGCSDQPGTLPLFFGADGEAAEFSTLNPQDDEYFRRTRTGESVNVSIRQLTDVLAENGCPPDFGILTVDVETLDLEVLQGLDFSRFRPRLIVTENYAPKDAAKFALLERNGYRLWKRRGVNTLWESSGPRPGRANQ